jgi:mycothiol synthase
MGLLDIHASELPDSDDVVYLDIRVHPEMIDSPLGETIITRGEELAREWRGPKTEVEISSYRDSTWAVELLRGLGYDPARIFERMAYDASDSHEAVHVPEGYTLRPLAGEGELDAWNALYNTAFRDHDDFHGITCEQRLVDMDQPSYVPDLDLVAVAPDGSLAAFCWIIRRMPEDGEIEWHVELVGTHRAHRKRGLAGALIQVGTLGIQERGGRRVFLHVDSASETGANRLYERLGFRVETVMIDFRKQLG